MVFHWSLSDSKSPQVTRTFLSILDNLNNAVIWMVSIHTLISNSSCPLTNPLMIVPSAPTTIGITVTFMFHSCFFFISLARSRYLCLFSTSFSFHLSSAETAKSAIRQVLFLNDRFWVVYISFVRMIKFKLLAQFPVDHLPTQSCLVLYSFCANLLHSLCNILAFDLAVNQETGASGRRYRGITLTCGRIEFDADGTPTGSRWMSNNYINSCHRQFELVRVRVAVQNQSQLPAEWEPAPDRGLGPSGPRLNSPAEWGRSASGELGVNMWQSVPSPTHLSHITNINPFATLSRIKCERYIFLKKCVRSYIIVDYVFRAPPIIAI